ncbi:DUF1684 domain-containing protein [Reichenbachiella agarivorans]|uniref:DUF1684 domain-containing protein n=1 Tax=Reichenbachiella agarivorans TaxID=2979464 RepID=A0ABY6CV50_9BACT|nr:DUF1684 domain-containing protein [Reichenbachiella agarivorans]UXP33779.1 DUF1684 domain-containing protein [Reichenbachiella agarivorans]
MKRILLALLLSVLIFYIFTQVNSDESSTSSYIESITKERIEKDQFMNTSSNSPFYNHRDSTIALKYYPIDETYKVIARVELIEENRLLTLGSSDGNQVTYRQYAYVYFNLQDQECTLLILKNVSEGTLFTAFADLTSASETYGAGRYLDLDFNRAKRITLDFNRAYNPYCNYNHDYSCPLPPKENMLNVAVRAGEKDFSK